MLCGISRWGYCLPHCSAGNHQRMSSSILLSRSRSPCTNRSEVVVQKYDCACTSQVVALTPSQQSSSQPLGTACRHWLAPPRVLFVRRLRLGRGKKGLMRARNKTIAEPTNPTSGSKTYEPAKHKRSNKLNSSLAAASCPACLNTNVERCLHHQHACGTVD